MLLTTQFGYDAGGRLTSVTDALNQITQYKYNEQGRMTDQIDANGHTTKFVYDIMGRLKEKTLPLGQKETYEYYPDGSLMAKVDANGTRTDYTYNSITKLLQTKSFSDGTRVDYTYWPDGSLKTATNSAGTTTYSYDLMGRLDRVVDPNNNVISYTYDRFGNRTQIAGPHGMLKYTYDQLGRIETVTDQQGNITRYFYDELGRQKKTSYANGTETLYTYDSLSRLISVTNRRTSGEIITSHKYTLDAAGHRIKIEEQGSVVEYGYDKLNRLTSEKRNGVVTLDDGYTYDPVGNRLTKASLGGNAGYVYDENDRLKSDGKYTYGWDENGNLTSRTGPDGSATYKYDPENRLIEASGANGTVQFAYDAQNNRISRTTASGTTTFVVDPNMSYAQVLEENGPAGAKVYAYGNDMLNVQGPEGTRWFAYDGLGSTRALTDSTGTLTDAYTYEAFGTVVHRTGTSANEFQFTGEQYESALDMYYLRARYYEPGTGRFGAKDPWPGSRYYPQSETAYPYCGNAPIACIDPSGAMTLAEISCTQAEGSKLDLAYNRKFHYLMVLQVLPAAIATYIIAYTLYEAVRETLISCAVSFAAGDVVTEAQEQVEADWGTIRALLTEHFNNFRNSNEFKRQGNHYLTIAGFTGPENTPSILAWTKKIGSVTVQKLNGGDAGRVFEFKYEIGTNAGPGQGRFIFRVDYLDYRGEIKPDFKPALHLHYHVGYGQFSSKIHHDF